MPDTKNINITLPETIDNCKLPNPDLLSFYTDAEKRIFWLEGEILEGIMLFTKKILDINREDKGIPINKRIPIKLFINSPGGNVEETIAFSSVIKLSKTPIWTINTCTAYSGACIVFVSGHKRFAFPNAQFLIHSGSGGTAGTFEQTEQQMNHYKSLIITMRTIIEESTQISPKILSKKFATEWYLDTSEALKYGIIDEVITDIDDIL